MKYLGYLILGALAVYVIYQFMTILARNKKNKAYLQCVNAIDDEEIFKYVIEDYLNKVTDEEFRQRGLFLKLYAAIMYKKYDIAEETLNIIDLPILFRKKGVYNKEQLLLNEDSFFYYCFMSSFVLYHDNNMELLNKLKTKIIAYNDEIGKHLFYQLYLASFDIYTEQVDHLQLFENINSGNYEFSYPKQMISLYKKLASVIYIKILVKNNMLDKLEDVYSNNFKYGTNLFRRICNLLDIEKYTVGREINEETTSK